MTHEENNAYKRQYMKDIRDGLKRGDPEICTRWGTELVCLECEKKFWRRTTRVHETKKPYCSVECMSKNYAKHPENNPHRWLHSRMSALYQQEHFGRGTCAER